MGMLIPDNKACLIPVHGNLAGANDMLLLPAALLPMKQLFDEAGSPQIRHP